MRFAQSSRSLSRTTVLRPFFGRPAALTTRFWYFRGRDLIGSVGRRPVDNPPYLRASGRRFAFDAYRKIRPCLSLQNSQGSAGTPTARAWNCYDGFRRSGPLRTCRIAARGEARKFHRTAPRGDDRGPSQLMVTTPESRVLPVRATFSRRSSLLGWLPTRTHRPHPA